MTMVMQIIVPEMKVIVLVSMLNTASIVAVMVMMMLVVMAMGIW